MGEEIKFGIDASWVCCHRLSIFETHAGFGFPEEGLGQRNFSFQRLSAIGLIAIVEWLTGHWYSHSLDLEYPAR